MTIERGQSWGESTELVATGPPATSDAELAAAAWRAAAAGEHLVASVTGGDLVASLGLSESRDRQERLAYPVDLGLAVLDDGPGRNDTAGDGAGEATDDPRPDLGPGEPLPFVAHLTVRVQPRLASALGHGPGVSVAVMNTPLLGDLRLGPRAHPNDGLLDVTVGRPRWRERREAARRARSGSHLPHPEMTTSRTASWNATFDRPQAIFLDGVERGRFRTVRVSIVPDALTVIA